jgi:HKD family nuclease
MDIVNQPYKSSIGEKIQDLLSKSKEERFDTLYVLSAYVKKSGVIRLQPFLKEFRKRGGKIRAVVGIDQKNTSMQGLELLIGLCDEICVYHSDSPVQTFHPKAYAFEKSGETAILIIGSSNLTAGGLYTNYELNSYYKYDLTKKDESDIFEEFKKTFEFYSTPSQCSKVLSPELLKILAEDDRYLSDEGNQIKRLFSSKHSSSTPRERLFGIESFTAPKIPALLKKKKPTTVKIVEKKGKAIKPENMPVSKGKLVWQKKLTDSDALTITKTGTNPTGGLRLTQARWKHLGKIIEQTTYFRDNLFGLFDWEIVKTTPKVEISQILFNLNILGQEVGTHLLKVRHKPSGEAEQGNYTTSISWGEVSEFIRVAKLSGKKFKLYAPEDGETEPFFIEIV